MPSQTQVERVRKLMRLSRSANTHEATAAAERAREIMARHQISEADIAEVEIAVADSASDTQRQDLAFVVAAGYGCTAVRARTGALAFRGPKHTVNSARTVYRDLARLAEGMCLAECIDSSAAAEEAWRLCFWVGFTDAILTKFLDRLFPSRKNESQQSQKNGTSPAATEAVRALEELGYEWQNNDIEDTRSAARDFMQRAYESGRTTGTATIIPNLSASVRGYLGVG